MMVLLTVCFLRTKLASSATPTTIAAAPSTEAETAAAVVATDTCLSDDDEEERGSASPTERADLFSVSEREGNNYKISSPQTCSLVDTTCYKVS